MPMPWRIAAGRIASPALTSTPARAPLLRSAGALPIAGDLDEPATLRRLAGLGTRVLHLAPSAGEPTGAWWRDRRTAALVQSLALRSIPRSFVYASTSG